MKRWKVEKIIRKPIFKFTCSCGKIFQGNDDESVFMKVSRHTFLCKEFDKDDDEHDWISEVAQKWTTYVD